MFCSGWKFYKTLTALKLHFSSPAYDVFKYAGKIRVSEVKYAVRNDVSIFEVWGRKFQSEKKMGHFIVANIIYGNPEFIYKPYAEAELVYLKWLGIRESITRTYETDVQHIRKAIEEHKITKEVLFQKTPLGNNPPLFQIFVAREISAETMVILNNEVNPFIDVWMKEATIDPYIFNKILTLKKYIPFVSYEKSSVCNITI